MADVKNFKMQRTISVLRLESKAPPGDLHNPRHKDLFLQLSSDQKCTWTNASMNRNV